MLLISYSQNKKRINRDYVRDIECLKVIVFLFLFNSVHLNAQSQDFIRGKVINSITLEPVPFATIFLKENRIGFYANADGDFRVVQNPVFQSDSLIITCIGFNRKALAFNELKVNACNGVYVRIVNNDPITSQIEIEDTLVLSTF